jgi:cytochrome P450 family 13
MARATFEIKGNNSIEYIGYLFPSMGNFLREFVRLAGNLWGDPLEKFMMKIEKEVLERKSLKDAGKTTTDYNEDFIDYFLGVETDEPLIQGNKMDSTFEKSKSKVSKQLNISEITAQCLVFLLAGFDTTANTLAVTCYYLAMHPECQSKLQEEIDLMIQGEVPTYEELSNMKYAEAIMKETLRLCPVAANVVGRVCAQTTQAGEYTIEEGTFVEADVLSLHYDKAIWGEDADKFRPERWLDSQSDSSEEKRKLALSWIPFGIGPRICVGMRFAYLEEKMALAYIFRKFNVRKCENTEVTLKMVGHVIQNPESVTVKLEEKD